MQYSWLEKMTKEGHVREEVRDRIYRDCGLLLEKIGAPTRADDIAKLKQGLGMLAEKALMAVPAMGGFLMAGAIYDKVRNIQDVNTIIKNKAAIMASPEAAAYKEKAAARFDELMKYAPRVATMPDLSKKLVLQSLHSGFTENDIRYLTSMQASYSRDTKDTQNLLQGYQKKMSKTSSDRSARLCGETVADMVCIIKEAANPTMKQINRAMGKKLNKAVGELKGAIKAKGRAVKIKPPEGSAGFGDKMRAGGHVLSTLAALTGAHLLIGVGTGAVNAARSAINKKNMEADLTKSFEAAMKQSDPMREPLHANKEKARQAFQTLTHFAPHMAVEPTSARAFMNAMVSHDLGTPIGSVKELSEIERNLKGNKGTNPFFEGLSAGLETAQFGKSFGTAVSHTMDPVLEANKQHIADALYERSMVADKATYR